MAKSARSKSRKHWASERRRTLGVPVETKQLMEQSQRLAANLSKQTSQPSIMKLKSVFKRPGSNSYAMSVQRRLAISRKRKSGTEGKHKASAVERESEGEMETVESAGAVSEDPVEEVDGMEVVPGKRPTGKARIVSRFKKSGQAFSAKKQKRVKS
ncbi:hypothetical protein Naga_100007g13 [Nannochloropsis gaditana]|uniref:Uncharacterized protein n=1 Tax=Nannochloropsis gaditana TaxID=72520 RepID=W7TPV8_9STRA|nr:hypothetical protein Naga_100007g13 [Nannochloropsis gaditana]